MKHYFIALIIICIPAALFAQDKPQLKSEVVKVQRSKVVESVAPRITLNEAKCRFDHISIGSDHSDQFNLVIAFARPCKGENEVLLPFRKLEDALLVKDLILEDTNYDFIHLTKPETGNAQFEIVYKPMEK